MTEKNMLPLSYPSARLAAVISVLTVLFMSTGNLNADVFSLWPFATSKSGASNTDMSNALSQKKLWDEKVIVNGNELSLGISLLDTPMDEAVAAMRRLFPKASIAMNSNSALFEIKLADGTRRRTYLVELNGMAPVLQFSMDVPPSSEISKPVWPENLPLPPGATPMLTMKFPKRNSDYGMFSSPYNKDQVINDIMKSLNAAGWKSAGKESSSNPELSTGDVFIRDNPLEIMILGVTGTNGTCRGTMYARPLK